MNKKVLVSGFLVSSVVFMIYAAPWEWLSQGVNENNLMLNLAVESLIQQFNGVPFKDPAKFNTFKLKLSETQRKIAAQTALMSKNPDAGALKKIKELVEELKKEEINILAEAQKAMAPEDYTRLKTAVDNRLALITKELTVANVANGLLSIWNKYAIPSFKEQVKSRNPLAAYKAQAKKDTNLSYNEEVYRSRRMPFVKRGLAQFFNNQLEKPITIGVACSGGGYRAMIASLGFFKGMSDTGLLDATMYAATLSGSTWFLVPWTLLQLSVADYKENLLGKLRANKLDLKNIGAVIQSDIKLLVNDIMWPKFLFDQPIGSIDLYGSLLARTLLADFGDQRQKQHLSAQWSMIQDGSKPFPIYTAVSMHKQENNQYLYNWYEFNPVDVRNLELNLAIPAYSFNSIFEDGVAKEVAPEQSLGFLMGIFGSAYAVNLKDINTIFFKEIAEQEKRQSAFEKIKYLASAELVSVMGGTSFGALRASPAQVNNPFKGMSEVPEWLKKREFITLVDGGIDYNIPGRSLLLPERKVDVMFILDASSNADTTTDLRKLFDDARRFYDYKYVRVDDQSNATIHIFKDPKNSRAPRIIYLNFLKDDRLLTQAQKNAALKKLIEEYDLTTFDVARCLNLGSCATFNFLYTEKDFIQLSGITEFNLKANKPLIENFILKEFKKPNLEDIEFEF